ncbi:hypothetical protein [Alsobacter sp. R-9]
MQIGAAGSTAAFSVQEQRRVTEQADNASLRDAAARETERQRQQQAQELRQVEQTAPSKTPGLGTLVDRFA